MPHWKDVCYLICLFVAVQLLTVANNIGLVHHLGNVFNDNLQLEVGSLIISFNMLVTKSESSLMVKPLNPFWMHQSIPKNVA